MGESTADVDLAAKGKGQAAFEIPANVRAGVQTMRTWSDAFVTERLLLRHWRDEDRAPFAAMNADPRVMKYFLSCLSRKESDALVDWNLAHFERHGFGLYAAEVRTSGEFAGFIGLAIPSFNSHFTPCVEIGWRLATRFWGFGLATEGARELLHYGLQEAELSEIVSFTVPANLRSRRVMEKLGLTRDPADDFDHPRFPPGHPLRRHVLYRIRATNRKP